jgi:glycerophosphoryl diester phosphodiesterase
VWKVPNQSAPFSDAWIAVRLTIQFIIGLFLITQGSAVTCGADRPVVIAHRGASGYLPEHTLAAKALAYGMGADFLEQDVVLTSDDHPIVLHDIHLDTVTDVDRVFPDRRRDDGRFYAIDFTLEDIRRLQVHERTIIDSGDAVFAQRFPVGRSRFLIPTLAEEIEMIQGLNRSGGRNVGIYPEIKAPAWHRKSGKDISRIVIQVLDRHGYRTRDDAVYLQCFDSAELTRIRHKLRCDLKLVQLIGENSWKVDATDYDHLRTAAGLAAIAEYADAIGPRIEHVLNNDGATTLAKLAHEHQLGVHPYSFRIDALPDFADDPQDLLNGLFDTAKVDGLFTDFPDVVVQHLRPDED